MHLSPISFFEDEKILNATLKLSNADPSNISYFQEDWFKKGWSFHTSYGCVVVMSMQFVLAYKHLITLLSEHNISNSNHVRGSSTGQLLYRMLVTLDISNNNCPLRLTYLWSNTFCMLGQSSSSLIMPMARRWELDSNLVGY
jgi:hypothetical protein